MRRCLKVLIPAVMAMIAMLVWNGVGRAQEPAPVSATSTSTMTTAPATAEQATAATAPATAAPVAPEVTVPAGAASGTATSSTTTTITTLYLPQEKKKYEWPGMGFAIKVGTLGVGGDLTVGIIDKLNLRGSLNWLGFTYPWGDDDDKKRAKLDLLDGLVLIDLHPGGGEFRISAGVNLANGYGLYDRTSTGTVQVGDNDYPGSGVGTLTRKVKFPTVAPYVGIGVGNAVTKDGSVTFAFDLGVIIPKVKTEVSADGPLAGNPSFQQDLEKEGDDFKKDVNKYPVYPVLMFGMAFKF